jgi:hypothetical protein
MRLPALRTGVRPGEHESMQDGLNNCHWQNVVDFTCQ